MDLTKVKAVLRDTECNIIDVGCHKAHFLAEFKSMFNVANSIGIDPCNYGVAPWYTAYYQVAVAEKEGVLSFNEYEEPGCNSLLEMNTDIVVHDKSKKGWYVGWDIEKRVNKRDVEVVRLDTIIKKHKNILPIHFLKIDTQGMDIAVVKSLGKYLKDVMFIQIEAVSSHDKDIVLYKGQSIMEEDIKAMKKLGFVPITIEDYSDNASPEANIIFANERNV